MGVNSGVRVHERGASPTFLGLGTQQQVLGALQLQSYDNQARNIAGDDLLETPLPDWAGSRASFLRSDGNWGHVPCRYAQTGTYALKPWDIAMGRIPYTTNLCDELLPAYGNTNYGTLYMCTRALCRIIPHTQKYETHQRTARQYQSDLKAQYQQLSQQVRDIFASGVIRHAPFGSARRQWLRCRDCGTHGI